MSKRYVLGNLYPRNGILPASFGVVADLEIVEWIVEQAEFLRIAQELYIRFPANSGDQP